MEYQIVESNYSLQVNEWVNKLLADGWELYGELKVAGVYPYESNATGIEPIFNYAQAMIKRTEELKPTI